MKDVWILIGNASGDISWGIDESYYIFGIYKTKEEAITAKDSFAHSNEPITITDDASGLYYLVKDDDCSIRSHPTKREQEIENRNAILKHSDLYYFVDYFNGTPIFCGGGWYIE